MNDETGPAFPQSHETANWHHAGLTKRELFAAMAMQGFLTHYGDTGRLDPRAVVTISVGYADALLAALEEKPKL